MSIVAVHGPHTFGSRGVVTAGEATATPDAANGLIWNFRLSQPSDKPAADFDWAFPGGTPATATDTKGPIAVTYGSAGAKTATLTVSGTGDPAAGSYPITVTAVVGAAPRELLTSPQSEEEPVLSDSNPFSTGYQEPPHIEHYSATDHTVDEVIEHAKEAEETEVRSLIAEEEAGKARTTLLDGLAALLPYSPGEHTVADVLAHADTNPGEVQALYDAEKEDKNRVTLLEGLEERGARA